MNTQPTPNKSFLIIAILGSFMEYHGAISVYYGRFHERSHVRDLQ